MELILICGTFGLMGEFGSAFFAANFRLFGILCYTYPPTILYLSYLIYQKPRITLETLQRWLATTFLFLLLLILQALSLDIGLFGRSVVAYLKPHLGSFGLWILSLFWIGVCLLALRDKDPIQVIQALRPRLSRAKAKIQPYLQTKGEQSKQWFSKIIAQYKQNKEAKLIEFNPSISVDLQDLIPENHSQIPCKGEPQPIPKEPNMPDDPIHIQEVIVTPQKSQRKSTVRLIDEALPQKENPFLHDDLSHPLAANQISTSAQLIRKIKGIQDSKEELRIQEDLQQKPLQAQEIQTQKLQISEILEKLPNPSNPDVKPLNSAIPKLQEETLIPKLQEETLNTNLKPNLTTEIQSHANLKQEIPEFEKFSSATQTSHSSSKTTQARFTHIKSLEENEALLKEIDQGEILPPKDYELPPLSLLSPAPEQSEEIDENEIDAKIQSLLEKLSVFKIDGDVIRTYSGPIITTLEFRPAPNVKVSRIQSLENDIAMALEAKSIRIQAPIPGKNVVGIEIPNSNIQTIYLREIFESEIFQNSASPLTLALGKDVVGNPFITDLKKLPHLLIAGTTGSGKSVGVNAMILSLLYRNSPEDLKLMMVDPKMVEFMPYSDLPHLITPIITDPKKAVIGLANAVREMERRYSLMSQSRTKEIVSYNQKAKELGMEIFPYFVIIIDELADLMMTAGKEVEYSMARIAQMGRASGMHLIVATQSPRAEVLTGLIKTNLPAHLSYKVGTKIDAGIIGCAGAETLLGRGDMLFTPPGVSGLVRLHAPWSSEEEVNAIVGYIKEQRGTLYDPAFLPEEKESLGALDCKDLDNESMELLQKAQQIILQDGKTSISYLQRRLNIGYNKAATLIEQLEQSGFLSPPDAKGNRQIL